MGTFCLQTTFLKSFAWINKEEVHIKPEPILTKMSDAICRH